MSFSGNIRLLRPVGSDGLREEVFEFTCMDNGDVRLAFYSYNSRPTKRHKFTSERFYRRIKIGSSQDFKEVNSCPAIPAEVALSAEREFRKQIRYADKVLE